MSPNLSVFFKIKEKYFLPEIWFVEHIKSVESKYLFFLSLHLIEHFILLTQIHDSKINNFSPM